MSTFESIPNFAKRVNLPERLLRVMVRQGQISHIKPGKSHAMVHVEAALEDLKKFSQQTAEEIAEMLPVPFKALHPKPRKKAEYKPAKKPRGRLPDSIRLAKKEIAATAG